MTKKSPAYVTEAVFKKETRIIHSDIGSLKSDVQVMKSDVQSLKNSVDRIAVAVVKTQGEIAEIRNDMKSLATKDDIQHVLNQMADFSKETRIVLQNQEVHRGYIHDHEERLIALEKRP